MVLKEYIEWLGYAFAFIGLVATITKTIQLWVSVKTFSWRYVDKMSKKLIKKIGKDRYVPDVIVGIGRGGSITGSILSGNICVPNKKEHIPFLGADRLYIWKDSKRIEVENEMIDLCRLEGKNILLVASDIMSGNTISFFIKKLNEAKVKSIKTACLVLSGNSTYEPTYFAKQIPSKFRMPWMYRNYIRDSREDLNKTKAKK